VIVYDGRAEADAWLDSIGERSSAADSARSERRLVRKDVNTTREANVRQGNKPIVSVDGRWRAG
jgi:hypothetical protein